jgi:hypothetical protein
MRYDRDRQSLDRTPSLVAFVAGAPGDPPAASRAIPGTDIARQRRI